MSNSYELKSTNFMTITSEIDNTGTGKNPDSTRNYLTKGQQLEIYVPGVKAHTRQSTGLPNALTGQGTLQAARGSVAKWRSFVSLPPTSRESVRASETKDHHLATLARDSLLHPLVQLPWPRQSDRQPSRRSCMSLYTRYF